MLVEGIFMSFGKVLIPTCFTLPCDISSVPRLCTTRSSFHYQTIQLIKLTDDRLSLENFELLLSSFHQILNSVLICLMRMFVEGISRPPPEVFSEVVVGEVVGLP